jgi:hypothetical protein
MRPKINITGTLRYASIEDYLRDNIFVPLHRRLANNSGVYTAGHANFLIAEFDLLINSGAITNYTYGNSYDSTVGSVFHGYVHIPVGLGTDVYVYAVGRKEIIFRKLGVV